MILSYGIVAIMVGNLKESSLTILIQLWKLTLPQLLLKLVAPNIIQLFKLILKMQMQLLLHYGVGNLLATLVLKFQSIWHHIV